MPSLRFSDHQHRCDHCVRITGRSIRCPQLDQRDRSIPVRNFSGINTQMISVELLHGERECILKTSGPFNEMFTLASDGSGGFSIDEPLKLSTMLASGFIGLKVKNETGDHLIYA